MSDEAKNLLLDPNDPEAWAGAYKRAETPWDLGGPTPEFRRLIDEETIFGPKPGFTASESVPAILVPGCGRGYDAIQFAEAGFRVVGLDFAPAAIREAQALQKAKEESLGRTLRLEFVQADYFVWSLRLENQLKFDYLVEYTFFCAIDPRLRRKYFEASARVLKPHGRLVGLFFPFEKREGGPPYGISEDEVRASYANLFRGEFRKPEVSIKPRQGRERLVLLEPLRTQIA